VALNFTKFKYDENKITKLIKDDPTSAYQLFYSRIDIFSLYFFPETIDSALGVASFHHDMYKAARSKIGTKEELRMAIAVSRKHAKTTTMTNIFPTWCTLFRLRRYVMIISQAAKQAAEFLANIKDHFADNERIIDFFGNWVPAQNMSGRATTQWSKYEITPVSPDGKFKNKIVARSTGDKIRGRVRSGSRPDLGIIDDMESEHNTKTPESMETNSDWFWGAAEPMMSDNGWLMYIFTPIGVDCIGQKILDAEDIPDWIKLHYPCCDDDGALKTGKAIPLWPEKYSNAKLLKKMKTCIAIGKPEVWDREWMLRPVAKGDKRFTVFNDHDFEYRRINDENYLMINDQPVPVNIYIGNDLAIAQKKDSKYTAFIVIAVDPKENIYVLREIRKRMVFDSQVETMFSLVEEFHPIQVAVEKVAYQEVFAQRLRTVMAERNIYFSIFERTQKIGKDDRIESVLQPKNESGKIFTRKEHTALRGEMKAFPNSVYKDALDAFEMAVKISSRAISHNETMMIQRIKANRRKKRSYLVA
jgi:predicted phage terminase large subunit-like protein